MTVHVEGLDPFVAALATAPWERELGEFHKDVAKSVADDARSRGQSLGGASGLTASAIATESSFSEGTIMASAPYARGSEFGSGGGPTTQQFARIPGANNEDGYWLGPALEAAQGVEIRGEKMLEDVSRNAFPE